MSKIDHASILDAKVDHHCRTAQARMRFGAGVWVREPPEPRNVARELEDALIVDLVDHPDPILNVPYIGREKAEIEALGKAGQNARDERRG